MLKHTLFALTLSAVFLAGCDAADPAASVTADARVAKAATPDGTPNDGVYVLIAKSTLPSDLEAQVAAAGGTLTRSIPEIGVAFATANNAKFQSRAASTIEGLEAIAPDLLIEWIDDPQVEGAPADLDGTLAADETFGFLQWPLEAINVEAAWAQGLTGDGVRVAIIDGGLWDQHIDLTTQIDRDASASFVPGYAWNEDGGTFWHGTHVSGIVAAADNGLGTVGVAPGATLVGVKALHDFDGDGPNGGSGAFSWIIDAIYYASTPQADGGAGANVINMSLGATLDEKDQTDGNKEAVRELKMAIDRATRYAWQQGALVVASAGNGATNFDVAKTLLKTPAANQHVMSVSSTGPVGWALGNDNFAQLSYFSDFGKKLIDVAAPGGNFALAAVNGDLRICSVAGPARTIVNYCYAFDGYFAPQRGTSTGSYTWAQGTSMASPTVAGVAALVMEKYGTGNPASTMSRIQSTATDLGKPGQDEVYGHGFVNAAAAVGATLASN